MPLAERDQILGDQPPFSPTPPPLPPPVPKYQQLLEAATDWTNRRGLLVPVSLFMLISFSTYLAYQSQVTDESATSSTSPSTDPDGLSSADSGEASTSTTATSTSERRSTVARSTDEDDSAPVSLTTTTTERPRRTTSRPTASSTSAPGTSPTSATTASTTTTIISTTSTTAPSSSSEPPAPTTTPVAPTTLLPTTTTTEATTTTEPPAPVPGPNELANPGFEQPRVDDGQFQVVSATGWTSSSGSMEVWGNGHNNINANGGRQFAELNVSGATTISQRVTVTPGATYEWSFAHRGRRDSDSVQVLIGGEVVTTVTSAPGTWNTVSGTTVIPEGKTAITFAIKAIDAGGVGNLVDRARFFRVANP